MVVVERIMMMEIVEVMEIMEVMEMWIIVMLDDWYMNCLHNRFQISLKNWFQDRVNNMMSFAMDDRRTLM